MNKLYLFFLLVFSFTFSSNPVSAQGRYNVNLDLHLELNSSKNTTKPLSVFVKGDLSKIQEAVRLAGGTYKFGLKNIASVVLPANSIIDFLEKPGVEKVEYYNVKGYALDSNDLMRENNNLDSLHSGEGNLPMPITGEGVIVATIDSGLEWQHPDFQNPDGSTRIIAMWDQMLSCTTPPIGFGFGCEFSSTLIDNGNIFHNPDVQFGHGTRVAGIAAGNGSAVSKYKGGAPNADIIHVNIDFNNFVPNFVDGIYYTFNLATSLGKPCVINSSVGYYSGPHDARELSTSMIENILNAAPGRVLVQAAGNGGDSYVHLNYPVTADTSFTYFRFSTPEGGIGWPVYAIQSEFDNVDFAIGHVDRNTFEYFSGTSFHNISEMGLSSTHTLDSINETVYHNGVLKGEVVIYGQWAGDSYYLYCHITPTDTQDNWEFQTTGSGNFHVWSHRNLITNSRMLEPGNVPTPADIPRMAYYQFPDKDYSIVGGWNCSEEVITVGNYNNAAYLVMYDTDTLWNNAGQVYYDRGSLVPSSSRGPTRLGVFKPDITASGNHTFSATSLDRLAAHMVNGQDRLAPEGWHVLMGGTSGSAPVVTGAVGCFLELFPEATHIEIRDALRASAKIDTFVTNGFPTPPSHFWGYGKLDAFSLVANHIVYGCTDPTQTNYNPDANVDDGTCFLSSGEDLLLDKPYLLVAPNPFTEETVIDFHLTEQVNNKVAGLTLYDMAGRVVHRYELSTATGSIKFERGNLDAGFYIWELSMEGETILNRKVVIF